MRPTTTVQDDVSAMCDFVIQVRALCARLTANPFNTPVAEQLLDLLIEVAPAADLALAHVVQTVSCGPASNGTHILTAIAQCGRRPEAAPVVCAAA